MHVKIQNLSFQYGNHTIFRNYSTQFPAHSLCLAPNGSGKTTLLRLIAGILVPQQGTITLSDDEVFRASLFTTNKLIFDNISLRSQFKWIQHASNRDDPWLESRIAPFGLDAFLDRTPETLSEGERQWAALAAVCTMPADIYLIDEPLKSLDQSRIRRFIKILAERIHLGECFVVAGHDNSHKPLAEVLEIISLPSPAATDKSTP